MIEDGKGDIITVNLLDQIDGGLQILSEIDQNSSKEMINQGNTCFKALEELFKSHLTHQDFQKLYPKVNALDPQNPYFERIHELYFKAIGGSFLWKHPEAVLKNGDYLLKNYPFYLSFKILYKAIKGLPTIISQLPRFIFQLPLTLHTLCKDSFIDGNSPWKQIKYALNIQSILIALQKDKIDIQFFKDEILKKESKSELEIKTIEIIDLLMSDQKQDMRTAYRQFVYKLREALTSDEFLRELNKRQEKQDSSECIPFLLNLCTYRFTEVHIHAFCEELVTMVIREGFNQLIKTEPEVYRQYEDFDPLDLPLDLQFKAIHAAPQDLKAPYSSLLLNSIEGGAGRMFDPQLKSNMPYTLYDFPFEERLIRVIRCGTPTYQNFLGKVTINPEFEYFLDEKKVVCIRLEDEMPRSFADESARNHSFKLLRDKYPQHFFLSILSLDSHFFYQTAEFADDEHGNSPFSSTEEWKKSFMSMILDQDKVGFYFPSEWLEDSSFIEELHSLWDEVHEIFFENKFPLNHLERCNFIIAYYIFIAFSLLKKTHADYFFFCCKDTADRSQILNACFLIFLLIFMGKELSVHHLRFLKVLIHSAALIVRKREMNERRERLLDFFEFLYSSEEIRERLRKKKDRFLISGSDIMIPESSV